MEQRCILLGVCVALLMSAAPGCYHSENSPPPTVGSSDDPAQQEFLRAFLTAHYRKDLRAQEELVDWDDVTEYSRDHFVREYIRADLDFKISSARIEDIPGLNPNFAARYNIPPEKFLVVVYDDPRGADRIKFPIGRKDGRYFIAMDGLNREAMQRNSARLAHR